ncbi:MAG: hypothetical protein FWG29_08365 [Treponema sp.]|nr:hypothetical protein [Treponema sp.]
MGTVYTEITLLNAGDQIKITEGLLKVQDVRSVTIKAMADTGAMYMVINEEIRQKLGLGIWGEKSALLANGQRVKCKETEPVVVRWKNRQTTCSALVISDAKVILFGAIPMEGMDLMVNPVTQEVVGAHGDREECLIL